MKKVFLGVLFAFVLTGISALESVAQDWKVDGSHSSVRFSVNHIFTPTTGKFNEFDGKIKFDPENLAGSEIAITVKVASVDTDNEKRDGHLQSADFFDAAKFPEMTFKSSKIVKKEGNLYDITGKMTIRDVTKEVTIPVTLLGIQDHPMRKGKRMAGFKTDFSINRNDYGVGAGSWTATAVVGEEVSVSVIIEASGE